MTRECIIHQKSRHEIKAYHLLWMKINQLI